MVHFLVPEDAELPLEEAMAGVALLDAFDHDIHRAAALVEMFGDIDFPFMDLPRNTNRHGAAVEGQCAASWRTRLERGCTHHPLGVSGVDKLDFEHLG